MIIDVNVLVYAHVESLPQHRAARSWFEQALTARDRVLLTWSSIHAFLRLTTKSRLFPQPFSPAEAARHVDSWLERPNVAIASPGPRYWKILRGMVVNQEVRGDLIMDAHIAALALENDAAVCTTDRDFDRFPGLRVINPLV